MTVPLASPRLVAACYNCKKPDSESGPMQSCTNCVVAFFCNHDCLRIGWENGHSSDCQDVGFKSGRALIKLVQKLFSDPVPGKVSIEMDVQRQVSNTPQIVPSAGAALLEVVISIPGAKPITTFFCIEGRKEEPSVEREPACLTPEEEVKQLRGELPNAVALSHKVYKLAIERKSAQEALLMVQKGCCLLRHRERFFAYLCQHAPSNVSLSAAASLGLNVFQVFHLLKPYLSTLPQPFLKDLVGKLEESQVKEIIQALWQGNRQEDAREIYRLSTLNPRVPLYQIIAPQKDS